VATAVSQLFANLAGRRIALPLLSQYLPEQFLAVLQGELAAEPQALLEHKIGRVLAQYARACSANAAAKHTAPAFC
jgi:D-tagatose-1,6-bisphosphate aldolase subunit GatZ/KbaZ